MRRLAWLLVLAGVGCGGDDDGPTRILPRASKSGTVDITSDDRFVAMVNPQNNLISVFDTQSDSRVSEVPTGGEPSSIVIAPDDDTAFVANRADATVVKITKLPSATPQVSAPLEVGSEPTGVA